MLQIIPSKDISVEFFQNLKTSGMDKHNLMQNILSLTCFKSMIERLLLCFFHKKLPELIINQAQTKSYIDTVDPYNFPLPSWLTSNDARRDLLDKCIFISLSQELHPFGYKVEHYGLNQYKISWE